MRVVEQDRPSELAEKWNPFSTLTWKSAPSGVNEQRDSMSSGRGTLCYDKSLFYMTVTYDMKIQLQLGL